METMESSCPNRPLIFDEIRGLWVTATPEEKIRQQLLHHLIHRLAFPKNLVAVEKELRQLPHLQASQKKIPDRRADIVCFASAIHPSHPLYPLLLIECKEEALNQKAIDQVLGYNAYAGAYFIGLVNATEMRIGYRDVKQQTYCFMNYLPTYEELLSAIKK